MKTKLPKKSTLKLPVKPLSVNKCWQGKRFKTKTYKDYEDEVMQLLMGQKLDIGDVMWLSITFGFSNKLSDIDNCLKPLLDILQKKYGFNDRNIYQLVVSKEIVKKGDEFIEIDSEASYLNSKTSI